MAQDIKKLFEQAREKSKPPLRDGHEARFLQKLEKQLPQKKEKRRVIVWMRVAAAVVIGLGIAWLGYQFLTPPEHKIVETPQVGESNTEPSMEIAAEEKSTEPVKEPQVNVSPQKNPEKRQVTLSDISPEFRKVEAHFISTINKELANLKVSEEDQEMVDAYLGKINELGEEYKKLNSELNTIGLNEMTITALIENLKLRLQLLQRLKKNLNHLKKDTNEKETSGNS